MWKQLKYMEALGIHGYLLFVSAEEFLDLLEVVYCSNFLAEESLALRAEALFEETSCFLSGEPAFFVLCLDSTEPDGDLEIFLGFRQP